MSVSVDGVPRYRFAVSTGRAGYGTPNGTYNPQRLAAIPPDSIGSCSSSQPKEPCETCGSEVSARTGVRPQIVLPAKMPRGVKGKIATH